LIHFHQRPKNNGRLEGISFLHRTSKSLVSFLSCFEAFVCSILVRCFVRFSVLIFILRPSRFVLFPLVRLSFFAHGLRSPSSSFFRPLHAFASFVLRRTKNEAGATSFVLRSWFSVSFSFGLGFVNRTKTKKNTTHVAWFAFRAHTFHCLPVAKCRLHILDWAGLKPLTKNSSLQDTYHQVPGRDARPQDACTGRNFAHELSCFGALACGSWPTSQIQQIDTALSSCRTARTLAAYIFT
jgi:hypothetical protein